MPRPEPARIVIDGSSLRYLNTGLGQFTYHLFDELGKLPLPEAAYFALVHPRYASRVPGAIAVEPATWIRRHAPFFLQQRLFRDCRVWHMTTENTRITGLPHNARVILTIHGLHFLDELPEREASVELTKVQRLVDRAEVVTAVSHYTEALIRQKLKLGGRKLLVIHNGVNREGAAARPSWAPKGKFLFALGSFFARKNFHVLVPAMKWLPGYDLILAGDTSHEYAMTVRKAIRENNMEGRVLLPGEVTEEEKQWLYQEGEALLFPSLSEGFGIPVVEAFRLGKPAFCSRYGSLPEIGGNHAFFWDGFEPEAMAQVVKEGLSKESAERSLARKEYAAQFSWSNMASAYREVYKSLL